MPRSATNDEKPKKRAPKKRASSTARKRTTRKAPAKKETDSQETKASSTETLRQSESNQSVRKAPTSIASQNNKSKTKRNQIMFVAVLLVVGIGGSAAVGFTDKGQINVNQAIEERNERLRNGQLSEKDSQRIIVPVQNSEANKLPDGGLVGFGVGAEPPAPKPEPATTTASSTATSTDETATSTDDGTDTSSENGEAGESDSENNTETESSESDETNSAVPIQGDNQATEEAPPSGP